MFKLKKEKLKSIDVGRPSMGKDKINKWIIALLIINLIMVSDMGVRITSEVKKAREDIRDLEYDLERHISNMERTIADQVQSALNNQNNPIQDISYDVTGLNENDLTAEVELKVELKEVGPDSEIRWVYEERNTNKDEYITLQSDGNLTFIGKLDLSIQRNYKTKLIEVQNNAAIRQLSSEPVNIDLRSRYFENRVTVSENSGSRGKSTFYKESVFEIRTIDESHLGLEKVEIIICEGRTDLVVSDISDEVFIGDNAENLKREVKQSDDYKSIDTSKHNEVGVSAESSKKTDDADSSINSTSFLMHYFYGRYVDYEDITDTDDVYIRYRFTFKDGYVEDEL